MINPINHFKRDQEKKKERIPKKTMTTELFIHSSSRFAIPHELHRQIATSTDKQNGWRWNASGG